jgi:16S rRNA processing protein RimM
LLPDSGDSAPLAEVVVLGKVVGPYGLRGGVKVHPFADGPEDWGRLPYWWVGRDEKAPENWKRMKVLRCKAHGDVLVAELEGISDRNASEQHQGWLVGVPRADLPGTAENEYYWADLVGLEVINASGIVLGVVQGLIETSANDVLRIVGSDARERLLPFVASVVLEVDLSGRFIRVDWEVDW